MHDASHGAYSDRPFVNQLMAASLDLVGGSSHFWHWKHVVLHHTFVNVVGYDTDINLAGLGRLTPHHPHAWFHRWQHWYVWLLYGAMVIKWHLYDDFRLVLTGRMGEHVVPSPRRRELVLFVGGKLIFVLLAFALPLLFHPLWVVAAVYALTASVTGLVLGVVFQLAHCVEAADFALEDFPGTNRQRLGGSSGRDHRRLRARQRRGGVVARRAELPDRASSVPADLPRELPGDRRRR